MIATHRPWLSWDSYTDEFQHDGQFYIVGIDYDTRPEAVGHYATIGAAGVRGYDIMGDRPCGLRDWHVMLSTEDSEQPVDDAVAARIATAYYAYVRDNF